MLVLIPNSQIAVDVSAIASVLIFSDSGGHKLQVSLVEGKKNFNCVSKNFNSQEAAKEGFDNFVQTVNIARQKAAPRTR